MLNLSSINNNNLNLSTNPVTVYMSSVSSGSRRTINQSLRIITQVSGYGDEILNYPWHTLRYQHVQAIRTYLADKYKHTTANKILAILKGVLKECKRLDLMSVADYDKAVDFKQVKGTSLPTGRWISNEEMDKLIATCDITTIQGLRNRGIFYCLQIGLRRSEVSNLKVEDFKCTLNNGKLQGILKVIKAKGNKVREVPLTSNGVYALKKYLDASKHEGYLFIKDNHKLTDQSIYNVVKVACTKAQVKETAVHDFRRSCASNLLEKGADLVVVQKILGHESVITTARYDRRGIEAQKKAIDLL